MKKNVFLLLSTALFLFASCSNEIEIAGGNTSPEGEMIFYLPGTTTIQAKAYDSDKVFLYDLDIYMFNDQTHKLEKIYRTQDIQFGDDKGICTATIDKGQYKGGKTFYFVANSENKSQKLNNLMIGVTDISEIPNLITDRGVNPNSVPLLMSHKLDINDISKMTKPIKADLECRTARFDLDNDPIFNEFKINTIEVVNTVGQTVLFSDKEEEAKSKLAKETYHLENFMDKKVFYLYPGIIGEGHTEFYFEGSYKGDETIYHLTFPSAIPIEANTQYSLKPHIHDNQMDAELKIKYRSDYNEESSVHLGIDVTDYNLIEDEIVL